MTETIDRNTTRLQHAFGVVWSISTMTFWVWVLSYTLLYSVAGHWSDTPVYLQASLMAAVCGFVLISTRVNSTSIRLECIVFVCLYSLIKLAADNFSSYDNHPIRAMAVLPVILLPLVGLVSDYVVQRIIKGQTRLLSEAIWFSLVFYAGHLISRSVWGSSHHGHIDDRELGLIWAVIVLSGLAAGVIHFVRRNNVRRNNVPPLCLPDISPLIRLAKFFRDGGLKVRAYLYLALFITAVAYLVYIFIINEGRHFI